MLSKCHYRSRLVAPDTLERHGAYGALAFPLAAPLTPPALPVAFAVLLGSLLGPATAVASLPGPSSLPAMPVTTIVAACAEGGYAATNKPNPRQAAPATKLAVSCPPKAPQCARAIVSRRPARVQPSGRYEKAKIHDCMRRS